MKLTPFNLIATGIALTSGVIVLFGYFFPAAPIISDASGQLLILASLLMAWAVVAGSLNLFAVHLRRMQPGQQGWIYSVFVVLGFGFVILLNLVPIIDVIAPSVLGWGGLTPANTPNTWIYQFILSPVSGALAGLMAFFMILAGYRLLKRRFTPMSVAFALTLVMMAIALAPLPAGVSDFTIPVTVNGQATQQSVRLLVGNWIAQVPATAGARGLLLGVALGTIATALRHLLAFDRPYGE